MKTASQCDLFWYDYHKHKDLERLRGGSSLKNLPDQGSAAGRRH